VALGLATPAVLIALTIAGSQAPGAAGAALTGNPAFDKLQAATFIQGAGCTSCHDFGGGGPAIGPFLGKGAVANGFNNDPAKIKTQIENGGNGMPPFKGKIPDTQIQAMTDFIVGLGTGKPPPQ
jgi:mono/diheme cytochrome c family protein